MIKVGIRGGYLEGDFAYLVSHGLPVHFLILIPEEDRTRVISWEKNNLQYFTPQFRQVSRLLPLSVFKFHLFLVWHWEDGLVGTYCMEWTKLPIISSFYKTYRWIEVKADKHRGWGYIANTHFDCLLAIFKHKVKNIHGNVNLKPTS